MLGSSGLVHDAIDPLLTGVSDSDTVRRMASLSAKHCTTLCEVFKQPPPSHVPYLKVVALLTTLGATCRSSKSGVMALLPTQIVWGTHRPHPGPNLDKGAVAALRKALIAAGLTPAQLACVCKP
jgi:hypothetical protein